MILFLAGCTLSGDDTKTTIDPLTDETLGGTPPGLGPDLVVTDLQIHSYTAEWVVVRSPITAGDEVFFDWSAVAVDAYGEARTADSFAKLVLFRVESDFGDLTDALATDELVVSESWVADVAGETSARASDLAGFAAPWFPEDASLSWLLALCDDDGSRLDIRAGVLLEPSETAPGTFLQIPSGGAQYSWLAQLDGEIVRTSAGHEAYTVDWSGVTTDGYGKPFDPALGDELFVGRFDDVDEADDLGLLIHDFEASATGWWTLPVGGTTSAALADATGPDGPFPGFEGDVVHVIGVRCSTCLGPAPLWVAGVDVRAP